MTKHYLQLVPEQFTIDSLDPANAITGFDVIRKGVTLRNTPMQVLQVQT